MSKILLHTCCAPCATYVNKWLNENNFAVKGFFYNPNIRPEEEYERRLLTMEHYATVVGLKLRGSFLETETFSLRFPIEPGECGDCYRVRLKKTAQFAKENNFDCFSTTLLISPYQKHDLLKRVGEGIGQEAGIEFYYQDFRVGYRESRQMARDMKLYRQKYCGCGMDTTVKEERVYAQTC